MKRRAAFAFLIGLSVLSWSSGQGPRLEVALGHKQPQPQPDVYKFAGLSPQKAAEAMTVPPGFTVKLFAGEPDVHQPIALCQDDRGRLWVAEAYSYPVRRPDKDANDRILIFEDVDGDGHFDKKTLFMEGLNLVSGIEYGFGGIWIGAAPYLMFVPIKEGEDKPAGQPQILLDGWGYQDTHETLNTFTWGPDGWLYGCHGVFTHSLVGKPGNPKNDRVPINAGVWRYHPTKHVFEVFAHGTSNPWGLDFNEHGQMFITACVIPHNFHIIQGGRYHRQAGQHFNPHTYADIQTIAEHRHYVGAKPHDGNGRSDSAGGGHAHCGAMVYLGGTWPKEYHGQLFMSNIHGHRINVDKLTPKGSSYVASRAPDFLLANDSWARFINMQYGPDGNVYLIDWYDNQACHDGNPMKWDRTNGRIYKICHKDAKPVVGVDLAKKTDAELVELHLHDNDWYSRHARRILQERHGKKQGKQFASPAVERRLWQIAQQNPEDRVKLRALSALTAINSAESQYESILAFRNGSPHIQASLHGFWVEAVKTPQLAGWATNPSPIIRLWVASILQRLPPELRWEPVKVLLSHAEDASDHNLPLMYWYAAEPLADADPAKALDLALAAKVPPVPQFMVRRVSSAGTPEAVALVVDRLVNAKDEGLQLAILRGMKDGLKGRRNLTMPASWPKTHAILAKSDKAEIRNTATALAVTFGDAGAFGALRDILASNKNNLAERQDALNALIAARDQDLVPVLHKLLDEKQLRGPALRGLASFDDPGTPSAIFGVYAALNVQEKRDAMNTLAARPNYGKALLEAVAAKKVPSNDLTADLLRQLRNLNDAALNQRIAEVWGVVRATPAERTKQIAEWKKTLNVMAKTDLSQGRAIYAKTCQQCHVLFGEGRAVGPDITGSDRRNLDYLLENILDPSAVIPKEYTTTVIELKDGRVITGLVKEELPAAITMLTVNDSLTIARGDVESIKSTSISMMPEDLLGPLSRDEVRALIGYLQSPTQVPMVEKK